MESQIASYNLTELKNGLKNGELSSSEICRYFIEQVKKIDSVVNAFIHFDEKQILDDAADSDLRRKEGNVFSDYDGIPIALKDLINVKDHPCSCGSKILENFISPYDSTVAERLRSKGFIFFGRANMDEYAMGSTCENSAFKITRNPWDTDRVPGGSSGGSAAAVSAGEVPVSLGSDTGGSIRQPAAFCGVVGLKPSYGRVSRYGIVAYASSLDQIGPFARDVEGVAEILGIISGHDVKDSTSLQEGKADFLAAVKEAPDDLNGIRIGLPKEYMDEKGLDADVRSSIEKTLNELRNLGAEIVDVSLPHTKYAVPAYYVIATAEASANLARFDGIRYGRRAEGANDILETYVKSRAEGFGNEVKRRILLGTYVLSSGYYDAYYLKAQKVRTLIRKDFEKVFQKCDVIFAPASPVLPFKIGEVVDDPVQMYLSDIFTISVNLAGVCGISVPSDIVKAEKELPMGVQFLGPAFGEEKILSVARTFEKNRDVQTFSPKQFGDV